MSPPPDSLHLHLPGLTEVTLVQQAAGRAVYRAHQPAMSREVLLEVSGDTVADTDGRARFEALAYALGRLGGHPNIVQVYSGGVTPAGQPYLVISGTSRPAAGGPQPWQPTWQQVLDQVVGLAGALETAHRAGIVHGAIRPESIWVTGYGTAQLAGFGAATTGPPPADEEQGRRADLAALGTSLHTLLAGAEVPAAVTELLTATAPGCGSAAELGRAAQRVQRSLGLGVTPLTLPEAADAAQAGARTIRRRRLRGAGVALVVLAVVVAGAWVVRPRSDGDAVQALRLDASTLPGEWQPDPELASRLRADPDAYLCEEPVLGNPEVIDVQAARRGVPGPRVGNVVLRFAAGTAEQYMAALALQGPCLDELPGLGEQDSRALDVADQARMIRYQRPAAQQPVTINLVYVRQGDVVSQLVHLGYPNTDPGLTNRLVARVATQLGSR